MISKELFARYVKDALINYYDPVHLQTHPLADLLILDREVEATRGQSLRQMLREAIESLRPERRVAFGRPEWFGYRIMWLRYIESAGQDHVCQELGLSRASFFRHHQDAFNAVTSILWDCYLRKARQYTEDSQAHLLPSPSNMVGEAVTRLAFSSLRRSVNLQEVLSSVQRTIMPLVREQGLTLKVDAPKALPQAHGDPALLRQIILNLLTEGFKYAVAETLLLTVHVGEHETIWSLAALTRSASLHLEDFAALAVSRGLLRAYGGRFWTTENGETIALHFTIPIAEAVVVLVIDDDTDMISLYQRYLQAGQFSMHVASSAEEAWALIHQVHPDLILLDVLMPLEDGWDILQKLKTLPETAEIPVVICSVLSQPRLALALGASEVLQKPITQERLLQTIENLLPQKDNPASEL